MTCADTKHIAELLVLPGHCMQVNCWEPQTKEQRQTLNQNSEARTCCNGTSEIPAELAAVPAAANDLRHSCKAVSQLT
jgi:hypothetical protein